MTSTPSLGAKAAITIGPNQQAVFIMDYDPRMVNVANISDLDGAFVFVWLYPSATAVTPQQAPIPSRAAQTLRPPGADGWGNQPSTLVIFNTSGVTLSCQERSN